MTLRKKATAIIYGTLMGLCLALAALLGWQTVRSYSRLEREDMGRQVSRAEQSLQASIDRIESIAGDWAPWDESYYFLKGSNPGYIANNLTETAFTNLGISLVAFITPTGSVH